MSNLCPINLNGGPITIILKADNGIRASAVIYFGKSDGAGGHILLETHKLATGDSGSVSINLTTPTNTILNHTLAWVINSCKVIEQSDNGVVKVELFQDGKKCKTISPTSYYGDFPKCKDHKERNIKSEVIFIQGAAPQTSTLWESIS
jgi:hypothetical protein